MGIISTSDGFTLNTTFSRRSLLDFIYWAGLSGRLDSLFGAGRRFYELYPFQWKYLESFVDSDLKETIAICTRGGSKTMLSALGVAYMMLTIPRFKVSVLSGSRNQSQTFTSYLEKLIPLELFDIDNFRRKVLVNGSEYNQLASTGKGVRSWRADMVVIDEAVNVKQDVLIGVLGQLSGSKFRLTRMLSTPSLSGENHTVKEYWDDLVFRSEHSTFNWDYKMCPWMDHKAVEKLKSKMGHSEWEAEYCGVWGSQTGSIFLPYQIDNALVDEIPDFSYEKSVGLDWGHKHYTVAVKGFELGDTLYVENYKYFNKGEMSEINNVLNSIVDFCENCKVYSEDAPISSYVNDLLEKYFSERKTSFFRTSFGQEKESFVQAAVSRFDNNTIKIYEGLDMLTRQLRNAQRDDNGKVRKGDDDFFDAFLHLVKPFDNRINYGELFAFA